MERVITCHVCFDTNHCFEEVQPTFSSYLCFNCGFMSDSRYEIGSVKLTENLKRQSMLAIEVHGQKWLVRCVIQSGISKPQREQKD